MANIVGCINTSHVPAIGHAIAGNLQQDPYWKPFFDGFPPVREWLAEQRPDVVVMFYNDHGLNFFLDKMPTFAVGAAPVYENADEGGGIPTVTPFAGDPELSWRLINTLVEREFEVTTCQEMLVDHAVTMPLKLLWPGDEAPPIRLVPICINTVQYPLPSAKRCFKLGQSVGEALAAWPDDLRILVVGSGGLSHQLDGQRAGFINCDFDLAFMDSLVNDPQWATQFSNLELVEKTGTQGVELLMWLAARATLPERVSKIHSNYHIPISNTASGLLALAAA